MFAYLYQLGGRIIRVDHVADYKPPKDEEEEARKRKLDAGEEVRNKYLCRK